MPRVGPGRPRKRPDHLIADKAYSHPCTRRALRRRHIAHSIPENSDQWAHRRTRGSAGGRPPQFDRDRYKQRNVVERCFNRLKQFRGLATRYARRAACYRAILIIAALVLSLREDPQDRPGDALRPTQWSAPGHHSRSWAGSQSGVGLSAVTAAGNTSRTSP